MVIKFMNYNMIGVPIVNGSATFFVGTGVSRFLTDNKAPSWTELLAELTIRIDSKMTLYNKLFDSQKRTYLDPYICAQILENEYGKLADTFGGSMFNISLSSHEHINPFDIPPVPEGETPSDVLRSHIVNLASLLKLMLGKLSPEEDALLDRAITETYASREIVADTDFIGKEPPLLGDLETILRNLEGGRGLAEKLYKYTKGSFAGFLNQPTNIDVANRLIVFSIRDLEEELRPLGMFVVLNYIWNLIRAKLAKRLLFIDEAWIMMQNDDSATFLFGLVKRARKYYLGVTTITQDVEDFLRSPYGRPIVTNSSLQLLLKQAPATIDIVAKAFDLTEAEKNFLLGAEIGTGIFFAGKRHVAIQIVPSYYEDQIITTNPEQLLEEKNTL